MPAALRMIRGCVFALLIARFLLAPAGAAAQATDTRELQAYLGAITHPAAADRTAALRAFLQSWPQSSLRPDALEWLAWDTHLADRRASVAYAGEVLKLRPANPIAAAVVLDTVPRASADATYDQANTAIQQLPSMRVPAGMGAAEFYRVQQYVTAALCAAIGNVQLERKDFATAREYLRRAATLAPHDARYAYALGLADLSGNQQNAAEGYLYLARAVNLAGGTPPAKQIDEYARSRYQQEGGRPGDWDRFLAAALVPNVPGSTSAPAVAAATAPNPAVAAAPPGIASRTSSATASGNTTATVEQPPADSSPSVTTATAGRLPRPSDLSPPRVEEPASSDFGLPGPDAAHRQPFRTGAPVSLGILVESELASGGDRKQFVNAIGDLVRHLTANQNSEAFVLSFGNDVVFNQDLTGNYHALEKAIEKIKPAKGAALLDAVTMAAFQLNRVSRAGNNRVLLVISDGRNLDNKLSPLLAGSQLETGAVRVYCIGVGALGTDGARILQTLAARTGGNAAFINDLSGIRGAAHTIAAQFGVEFPY